MFMVSFRPALLALSALALGCQPVLAATSVSISPLSLKLAGAQRSAQLTLRNVSAQTATFRMELARWTQDGQDHFEPTGDVIVNPSSFRLAPGQEQTVRVALRGAPGSTERAYRVFIQELPPVPSVSPVQDSVQVTTLYRVSVPMLILPTGAASKLQFTLNKQGEETVLSAVNTGTRYATVTDLQLTAGGQTQKISPFNLLAGGTLRFPVPDNAAQVALTFTQQDVPQTLKLTLSP